MFAYYENHALSNLEYCVSVSARLCLKPERLKSFSSSKNNQKTFHSSSDIAYSTLSNERSVSFSRCLSK